jgi:hypothetical protein
MRDFSSSVNLAARFGYRPAEAMHKKTGTKRTRAIPKPVSASIIMWSFMWSFYQSDNVSATACGLEIGG